MFFFFLFSTNTLASWDFMFASAKYQEKLQVESLLIDKNQVGSFFNGEEVKQQPCKNLSVDKLNLVVRIKNTGDLSSWGILNVDINGRKTYEVNIHSLPANMKYSYDYVIPISGLIIDKNEEETLPIIKMSWKKLYSK